nr:hypothetical protein [Desulfobulbaceae bacterium]
MTFVEGSFFKMAFGAKIPQLFDLYTLMWGFHPLFWVCRKNKLFATVSWFLDYLQKPNSWGIITVIVTI